MGGRALKKVANVAKKVPAAILAILHVAAEKLPPDEIEIKKDSVILKYKKKI